MRFEIPFDEKISRRQNELWFKNVFHKKVKQNKSGFYFGLGFILLGALIIYGKNDLGHLFLLFGLFIVIIAYRYYRYYRKRKKIFFESIESLIQEFKKNESSIIIEFGDENYYYKDFRYEVSMNWSIFYGFKLIENTLFIFFDKEKLAPHMIGKEEVGKENFDKIIQLLNRKKRKILEK